MKKMFKLFNKQRNWHISCWPWWYFCLLDWQEKSNSKFIAVDKTVELVFSHIINLVDLFKRYLLGTYISVSQFSHSVVSNSLRPHELQHARPPCPSTTPGVHSDSRPLSQWCHWAISSSVIPFSSCPQSLLASGSFTMSQLFAWGARYHTLLFFYFLLTHWLLLRFLFSFLFFFYWFFKIFPNFHVEVPRNQFLALFSM